MGCEQASFSQTTPLLGNCVGLRRSHLFSCCAEVLTGARQGIYQYNKKLTFSARSKDGVVRLLLSLELWRRDCSAGCVVSLSSVVS